MITKQEILTVAKEQDLLPTTIEKDYAIGLLLAEVSENKNIKKWVFKGGTCLKKCYFNTYRFSEDLDFTLLPGASYNKEKIETDLREIAELASEKSGVNFFPENVKVEGYENKRGKISFQCRVVYHGPLSLPQRSFQRIKFDLTNDEVVVDTPILKKVNHPYSDFQNLLSDVLCYSINDILAEKTRAMVERNARARDLYDIIHINRSFRKFININKARASLIKKFEYKSLPTPTVELILSAVDKDLLASEWKNQLGHQLPILPPVGSFIDELHDALVWWMEPHLKLVSLPIIENKTVAEEIPMPHYISPTSFQSLGFGESIAGQISGVMNKIQYAARNNLLVKITYHGVQRIVEPYSVRKAKTGNVLLYGFESFRNNVATDKIKAFKINEIQNPSVTKQSFTPRYKIEL